MDRPIISSTNKSENITPDSRGLSLYGLSEEHVTIPLYDHLVDLIENENFTKEEKTLIYKCLLIGLRSHANDKRANGDKYTDHLLEATITVMELLRIRDANIIAATPIHDILEDHPLSMVGPDFSTNPKNKYYRREFGKKALIVLTNSEVARIVDAVTNPILETGQDKQEIYEIHSQELMKRSPDARPVKHGDFLSNTSKKDNVPAEKQSSLDLRYVNLFAIHKSGLYAPDSLVTGEARETTARILEVREKETIGRIAIRNVAMY